MIDLTSRQCFPRRTTACSLVVVPFLLLVLALPGIGQDKPYIIDSNGKKWVGADLQAYEGKMVLTSSKTGKTKDFPLGSYRRAHRPMPNQYATALRQYEDGDTDNALRAFKKVQDDNRFFEWERRAALFQIRIHMKAERDAPDEKARGEALGRAQGILKKIAASDPSALKVDPYIQLAILEMSKKMSPDKFEDRVVEALAHADRGVAAVATVWEADRLMTTKPELALVEFKRVLDFFGDQSPELLAEASYKAGKTAKRLRQNALAEEFFRKTKEDYSDSTWASKAP